MSTPAAQLEAIRQWQTLASYVRYLGGKVGSAPRTAPQEVLAYFRNLLADPDLTEQDILHDHLPAAQRYAEVASALANWRQSLKSFQSQIHALAALSVVPLADRNKFVEVIGDFLGRMSVQLGLRTENYSGVINISRTVIDGGADTAMFALFHELGHGVQTEHDVPSSVKQAIYTSTEQGAKFGEMFADAFAALALSAIGCSLEQVLRGAEGALADHGEDGDHPDWSVRRESIRAIVSGL